MAVSLLGLGLGLGGLTGCGGDSLRLGLPDGNRVRYVGSKPASGSISASCDTVNASVFVSNEERNGMRIRCVVQMSDREGNAITEDASIAIEAVVQEQGHAPEDGSEVHFTTTVGSFAPFGDDTVEPLQDTYVETHAGKAVARLYTFPGSSGEGRVTASYETINARTVTDSTQVTVSPGLSVVMEANCKMQRVYDEMEHFVFMLNPSCDPLDVEPLTGEPSHMENGTIHNPRDGLFSIVFYVDGEEFFDDQNNNGQYDPGEVTLGSDIAEPFVDADDDGDYGNNEPFVDLDGDNEWSDANGRWDGEVYVWTTTHIMFTGPPHEGSDTTRFEPSGISIEAGGSQRLYLYLMDINHNPIAANGTSDSIEFTIDGGANLQTSELMLTNHMGVEFKDGRILPNSFNENRDYAIDLADADPSQAESVTLHTTVNWTPAPDNDLYSATPQTLNLADVTGTAN
ncbi:MAG: hypothetical protein DRI34_14150 [Deltaproteobacteria bacterium]|nr:MAG: hypothetical protein DRI34_14150 [Deltaproteobacteria bacterium]